MQRYHEDSASLQRETVGSGLMGRDGGRDGYWKDEAGISQLPPKA